MSDVSHGTGGRAAPRRTGGALLGIIAMAIFWVAFSGKFDALHLSYGVLSIVLVVLLTRKIVAGTGEEESVLAHLHLFQYLGYALWLLTQIIVANLQVAVIILSPRLNIDPKVLRFRFPVDRSVAKVSLGNSITLTPGTFTVDIHDDEFVIHTIHPSMASSLLDGTMQQRVARAFGEPSDFTTNVGVSTRFPQAKESSWTG